MTRTRKMIVATFGSLTLVAVAAGSVAADPASSEHGCHGYYTTQFKTESGDRGAQGWAIGGLGASDDDPTNGQAHSDVGRGAMLQEFLVAECGK